MCLESSDSNVFYVPQESEGIRVYEASVDMQGMSIAITPAETEGGGSAAEEGLIEPGPREEPAPIAGSTQSS